MNYSVNHSERKRVETYFSLSADNRPNFANDFSAESSDIMDDF